MKIANTPGGERIDRLPEAVLGRLRESIVGDVIDPDDDGYDDARQVWNGMINRYPAAIARCTGTADVVAAVTIAREHDVQVAVRGGGHNVAGSAVNDGGLVIDLSAMTGVHVDPEAQTVRAQGGCTLGQVDRETQVHGLATPLGVVSKTGIAGLTLNGGMGHLRREHGLSCDNLRSLEVVTANGQVVTASEDSHPDLFWALRGGGGNFGVVTAFEYECYEVGPDVFVLFTWYHGDDARAVLDGVREWTTDAPRGISLLPFWAFVPELDEFPESAWGEPALVLFAGYDGTKAAATETVAPLRNLADPIADLSGPTTYTDLQSMLDADYPDGRRYYWKSVFLAALSEEVIDLVVEYGRESPSKLATIDIWHLGGAVADLPQDATAFWHREKPYMLNFEANWDDPADDEANVGWVRSGIADLRDLDVASGQYGNFPGFAEDPAKLLYGDNYDRLVEVKTDYDPENLFRGNQNIQPAG